MSAGPRAVTPAVNSWNAPYLQSQYERFKADPSSIPEDMRAFFQGFDLAVESGAVSAPPDAAAGSALEFQSRVNDLIVSYQSIGHLAAKTDPFGREPERPDALSLEYHGLSESDLDRTDIVSGSLPLPDGSTLRDVVTFLEKTYCSSIGLQNAHVSDIDERRWLRARFEEMSGKLTLDHKQQAHLLEQLVKSEQFERFIGKRYPGEKRFSLEGGETLIPFLNHVVEVAADSGVEEMVIGMPHRGRLNVLNNVLGKTYEQIFTEFEDNFDEDFADGGGDVKYHRGYSSQRTLPSGSSVHLALASNPSHLESVGPVVEGRTRAKQRLRGDTERTRVVPVLIHGDGAVIGQGVVMETLNLSQLDGYTTGGTIHIVVNNLIGFTTGPDDARSSRYCTDIGLMVEAPVLHVNGEDPEAVITCAQLAVEYRQRYKKDMFIDLVCYRKYGHNEQDEPTFTQPILAKLVKKKRSILRSYSEYLRENNIITDDDLKAIADRLQDALEAAQSSVKDKPHDPTIDPGSDRWSGMTHSYSFGPFKTGVSKERLQDVCEALGTVPEGFNLNPKLRKLLDERKNLVSSDARVSYADAESLAYGTLLLEGYAVRLSGQDSRRGTFSHRHAVLRDFETGEPYMPLNNLRPIHKALFSPDEASTDTPEAQGHMCVYDSPLSEAAVLAFDYGYSLADPHMLVLWEAQFGDFSNGAQVIIDQYLASAELKWDRWSGLVMLLPHGYEGAGPEHSSARVERFLKLCGNDNLQVIYPSTASQIFHALRRQMHAKHRKPLIVLTPKSMLRVPTSDIQELTDSHFKEMIDDPTLESASKKDLGKIKRIVLCTGKLYHELAQRRDEVGRDDTALVRIEQYYPFNTGLMKSILDRYPDNAQLIWAQEEPRNAGAFHHILDMFRTQLGITDIDYIGRQRSATPATGSKSKHKQEQEALLTQAIGAAPGQESNGSIKLAGTITEQPPKQPAKRVAHA